jgi:hypothetical protein
VTNAGDRPDRRPFLCRRDERDEQRERDEKSHVQEV